MPINAEDLQRHDEAVKTQGTGAGKDMDSLHKELCDDALLDPEACANYINHYTKTAMPMLATASSVNERLSALATVLRHVLLVGVNAGRDDQPLV